MGLATCWIAAEKRLRVLDYVSKVPSKFPVERFRKREDVMRGALAVGTPSNLAGWCELVRTHGRTGRKALYVFEGECVGIEGMPDDEAIALIRQLHEHCLQPQFIYRHRWRVGDVVMWDNCQSLHYAVGDYALPQRRLLHRTTIEGAIPI